MIMPMLNKPAQCEVHTIPTTSAYYIHGKHARKNITRITCVCLECLENVLYPRDPAPTLPACQDTRLWFIVAVPSYSSLVNHSRNCSVPSPIHVCPARAVVQRARYTDMHTVDPGLSTGARAHSISTHGIYGASLVSMSSAPLSLASSSPSLNSSLLSSISNSSLRCTRLA